MQKIIAVVEDRKSGQFGPPMGFMNDADAIRSFIDAINTPSEESLLYKHSDDFDLVRIGTYDTDTGVLTVEVHRRLLTGNEAVHVKDPSVKLRGVN